MLLNAPATAETARAAESNIDLVLTCPALTDMDIFTTISITVATAAAIAATTIVVAAKIALNIANTAIIDDILAALNTIANNTNAISIAATTANNIINKINRLNLQK